MNTRSAVGRTLRVTDPDARLRLDDLRTLVLWSATDARPPGSAVGAPRLLPVGAPVTVAAIAVDSRRRAFAQVSTAPGGPVLGWTAASNLEGGLLGETVGLAPAGFVVEPDGVAFTVTDHHALVRGGAPGFAPTGALLAVGTQVRVTARSPAGAYVRVAAGQSGGADVGWTALSNLSPGWCPAFAGPEWQDPPGPFGAWDHGKYLGPPVLVRLVGVDGEVESITLDTLGPWLALSSAAAAAGIALDIQSGFRSWPEQAVLYAGFVESRPGFNRAAKPGSSNHQHGQALDLNTGGFDTPAYRWLAANATAHGFVRTVPGEHWHWEYRPDEAPALRAAGRCAREGVAP